MTRNGRKSRQEMIDNGLRVCYQALQSLDEMPIKKIAVAVIGENDERTAVDIFGIDSDQYVGSLKNVTSVVLGFCQQRQFPVNGLDVRSVRDDCHGHHGHYITFEEAV